MRRDEIGPLTSLRFFAAAAIVLHHITGPFGLPHVNLPLAQAVPFFFVLSGFILTYNYEGAGDYKPAQFLINRFARLWPVHIACIVIGFVLLPSSLRALEHPDGWAIFATNVLMLHDWVPNYGYAFSFNSVSWSISAEFFFYLMFPLMIASRSRMLIGLALSIGLNVLLAYMARDISFEMQAPLPDRSPFYAYAHLHPLASIPGFIAGMLAASVFRSLQTSAINVRVATVTEVMAVALTAWWLAAGFRALYPAGDTSDFLTIYYTFNSGLLVAPVIVFVFAWNAGLLSRALSWSPLVFLGKISFSTYMIHQLVIRFAVQEQLVVSIGRTMALTATVVAIYLASWALWRFVEVPGRRSIIALNHRLTAAALRSPAKSPG